MTTLNKLNLSLNASDPIFKMAAQYLQSLEQEGRFFTRLSEKDFFIYEGKYWKPIEEAMLRSMVATYLQQKGDYSGSLKKALSDIIQAIKDILGINDQFKQKVLHPDRTINFKNGILHVDEKTGHTVLQSHAPTDYALSCSSFSFVEKMDCPLFDKTLYQIFQQAEEPNELVEFIYEIIGYILSGIRTYPIFIMLIGNGANGKSLILKIISELLGHDCVIHDQIKTFSKDSFNTIGLMGKKAFIDDDIDLNFKLSTGMIKKMSEEKTISARDVYKSKITFSSFALPIIAGNDFPRCEDITHGMKRRICVIPFNHIFGKEEINPHHANKIIETEAEGIIAKSLMSLQSRINKKGFYPDLPSDVKGTNEKFFSVSDPLSLFMKEQTMALAGSYIKLPELRIRCERWVQENCIKNYSVPVKKLKQNLFNLGYTVDKKVDGTPTVHYRAFVDD